jgi:hypothetical protein
MLQVICIIAVAAFFGGAAMLNTKDSLLAESKTGDESMHSTTLGQGQGVNDIFNRASLSDAVRNNLSFAQRADYNHRASEHGLGGQKATTSQLEPSKVATSSSPKAQDVCVPDLAAGKYCETFWQALVRTTVGFIRVKAEKEFVVETGRQVVSKVGDAISGAKDLVGGAWSYLTDSQTRDEVNHMIGEVVADVVADPQGAIDKVVAGAKGIIDNIDRTVHEASLCVAYCSDEDLRIQNAKIASGILVTVGGAAIGVGVGAGVTRAVGVAGRMMTPSGRLKNAIDRLKTGERLEIPTGKGAVNKNGLVAYLNKKDVEYSIARTEDGRLMVARGTKKSVKLAADTKRSIYHNHPSHSTYPSGHNYIDVHITKQGDIHGLDNLQKHRRAQALKAGKPIPKPQRSTIIGSRDGTRRHRLPSADDFKPDRSPERRVLGGTAKRITAVDRSVITYDQNRDMAIHAANKARTAATVEKSVISKPPPIQPAITWSRNAKGELVTDFGDGRGPLTAKGRSQALKDERKEYIGAADGRSYLEVSEEPTYSVSSTQRRLTIVGADVARASQSANSTTKDLWKQGFKALFEGLEDAQ